MRQLTIMIAPEFNTNSVAEEISHQLQEENYDLRAVDITVNEEKIQIKSDIIRFDEKFLDVISAASDGFRTGMELDEVKR